MSTVLADIVARHAEEAAFLWLLRDRAVSQPNYHPRQLAELDDRVEAHLDGLRIAGDAGWDCAATQLELAEPGEVFVATALAFGSRSDQQQQLVLAVVQAKPSLNRALAGGLAWLPSSTAMPFAVTWLTSKNAALREAAVRICAAHRQSPPQIEAALYDDDLNVRARAFRATAELGEIKRLPVLKQNYRHADARIRFAASWAGAVCSADSAAIAELQTIALTDRAFGEAAAEVAARRLGPAQAQAWLRTLMQIPEAGRAAMRAIGALGDPTYVPPLLAAMKKLPLARLAGEAVELITGADLALNKLDAPQPADFSAGPSDDAAETDVSIDQDANLLWPDPAAIESWWTKHQGHYQTGRRYLLGKAATADWIDAIWKTGRQRQRIAAALESSVQKPIRAWKARIR